MFDPYLVYVVSVVYKVALVEVFSPLLFLPVNIFPPLLRKSYFFHVTLTPYRLSN